MQNPYDILIPALVLLLLLIPLIYLAVKVVREYQRLVIFRLGRCIGDRGPGLVVGRGLGHALDRGQRLGDGAGAAVAVHPLHRRRGAAAPDHRSVTPRAKSVSPPRHARPAVSLSTTANEVASGRPSRASTSERNRAVTASGSYRLPWGRSDPWGRRRGLETQTG